MRILLDTHVLIGLAHAPDRISEAAREKIAAPVSTLYISPVSIWEMTIKVRLGKLDLGTDVVSFARTAYLELAALDLALALDHFGHLSELPLHHHDSGKPPPQERPCWLRQAGRKRSASGVRAHRERARFDQIVSHPASSRMSTLSVLNSILSSLRPIKRYTTVSPLPFR